jgi:hypothetical protein
MTRAGMLSVWYNPSIHIHSMGACSPLEGRFDRCSAANASGKRATRSQAQVFFLLVPEGLFKDAKMA